MLGHGGESLGSISIWKSLSKLDDSSANRLLMKKASAFRPRLSICERCAPLLLLAVLVELRDVGPEVVCFRLVLDAGEGHLGAGDLGLRVLDIFEELLLVPGNAGALVGIRIGVIR